MFQKSIFALKTKLLCLDFIICRSFFSTFIAIFRKTGENFHDTPDCRLNTKQFFFLVRCTIDDVKLCQVVAEIMKQIANYLCLNIDLYAFCALQIEMIERLSKK